jgi:hypothetical protein
VPGSAVAAAARGQCGGSSGGGGGSAAMVVGAAAAAEWQWLVAVAMDRLVARSLGLVVAVTVVVAVAVCWRTYEKHERKEGAKQEPVLCLVGR